MSSVKSPQPQQRLSTATLDITKSPAFLKLKAELDSAKEQLQSKEEQVDKLSKIRDEVNRGSFYGIMNYESVSLLGSIFSANLAI